MGTPQQIYIDPSIAGDSGTGTIGDPFGDIQYCLNQQGTSWTRDATNGDQLNIKAGTSEVLAAALTLATYGTPTEVAPLIMRGYTSAANDGGIGVINCNSFAFNNGTALGGDAIFADLHITNSGATRMMDMRDSDKIIFFRVKFSLCSESTCIFMRGARQFIRCHFVDIIRLTTDNAGGWLFDKCFFENGGTNAFSAANGALTANGGGAVVVRDSIFKLGGTASGILCGSTGNVLLENCSLSGGGTTGFGIDAQGGLNTIRNNIFSGFSGSGGIAIKATDAAIVGPNGFYNNATGDSSVPMIDLTADDVTFTADPFTSVAGNNFAVTAEAAAKARPNTWLGASTTSYADLGAAQREATGGGGASPIGLGSPVIRAA